MRKFAIFITALAFNLPVFAAAGEAASQEASMDPVFSKLDVNHDGYVDKTEAKADKDLNAKFDSIAKNGKLDQKAFDAWKSPKAEK